MVHKSSLIFKMLSFPSMRKPQIKNDKSLNKNSRGNGVVAMTDKSVIVFFSFAIISQLIEL